jgi:hypothetical protein
MKKILFFAVMCFVFGCDANEGVPVDVNKGSTKADFRVEFLFEFEDIKIFRFYDEGYYRYFSIGNGKTSTTYSHYDGVSR